MLSLNNCFFTIIKKIYNKYDMFPINKILIIFVTNTKKIGNYLNIRPKVEIILI